MKRPQKMLCTDIWSAIATHLKRREDFRAVSRVCQSARGGCLDAMGIRDSMAVPVRDDDSLRTFRDVFAHYPVRFHGIPVDRASYQQICSLFITNRDITDSSFFLHEYATNILQVDLQFCHVLTDVSALGAVQRLTISSCHALADISGLGRGNQRVTLSCLPSLTDVSCLGTVAHVVLHRLELVADVSQLETGSVQSLEVADCYLVTSVRSLGRIPSLKLESLFWLTDVPQLPQRDNDDHYNPFDQQQQPQEEEQPAGLTKFDISSCNTVQLDDIRGLGPHLQYFRLAAMNGPADLTSFQSCQEVVFAGCTEITNFDALASVKVLRLHNIQGTITFSSDTEFQTLELIGCKYEGAPRARKLLTGGRVQSSISYPRWF